MPTRYRSLGLVWLAGLLIAAACSRDGATKQKAPPKPRTSCSTNTDCELPLVCAADSTCRALCVQARDCREDEICVLGTLAVCATPDEVGVLGGKIAGRDAAAPPDAPSLDGVARASDGGAAFDLPPLPDQVLPLTNVTADRPVVRQGETLYITVTGANLTNPTRIDLGPGVTALVTLGATDTMFTLIVAVAHGAALGPRDLVFSNGAAVGRQAAVFTIREITASPAGDDLARGSADNPVKTFSRAVALAAPGDSIRLLDGTYSAGETWSTAIPDKVTVAGQSSKATVLRGPGLAATAAISGLVFAGDATVRTLTVTGFNNDVRLAKRGTVTLEDVRATDAHAVPVYVDATAGNARLTIKGADTLIDGQGSSALQVSAAGVNVTVSGGATLSSLAAPAVFLSAENDGLTMDGAVLSAAGLRPAVYAAGAGTVTIGKSKLAGGVVIANAKGVLSVTDSTLTPPAAAPVPPVVAPPPFPSPPPPAGMTAPAPPPLPPATASGEGIRFAGTKLTLTAVIFDGGSVQVQETSGQAIVRSCQFKNYLMGGLEVSAGTADLGTAAAPGMNAFAGPATAVGLRDSRPLIPSEITVSATTFNGAQPAPRVVTKSATEPGTVAGQYMITTLGNTIHFF